MFSGQAFKISTTSSKSSYHVAIPSRFNVKYLEQRNYPKRFYDRIYEIVQNLNIKFSNTNSRRLEITTLGDAETLKSTWSSRFTQIRHKSGSIYRFD